MNGFGEGRRGGQQKPKRDERNHFTPNSAAWIRAINQSELKLKEKNKDITNWYNYKSAIAKWSQPTHSNQRPYHFTEVNNLNICFHIPSAVSHWYLILTFDSLIWFNTRFEFRSMLHWLFIYLLLLALEAYCGGLRLWHPRNSFYYELFVNYFTRAWYEKL